MYFNSELNCQVASLSFFSDNQKAPWKQQRCYPLPAAGLAPDGDRPPAPTEVAEAGAGILMELTRFGFDVSL